MATFSTYLRQIGRNIKGARQKRGLRQSDVETAAGLSYRHYQNIEAGKVNVTIETLFRLSKLYKVHVEDLVKDSGPGTSERG
jgi:transcriptional regulator with XRE-family HTH domain